MAKKIGKYLGYNLYERTCICKGKQVSYYFAAKGYCPTHEFCTESGLKTYLRMVERVGEYRCLRNRR